MWNKFSAKKPEVNDNQLCVVIKPNDESVYLCAYYTEGMWADISHLFNVKAEPTDLWVLCPNIAVSG